MRRAVMSHRLSGLPVPRQGHRRARRALAALSYVGGLSLIVAALLPRSPFVLRHALAALTLHLARLAAAMATIVAWSAWRVDAPTGGAAGRALDFSFLLLTGIPWPAHVNGALLGALALPLGVPWLLALAGVAIAATGHSADLHAFLHASWPDEPPEHVTEEAVVREDRERTRDLLDRRAARIWQASQVGAVERRRAEQRAEIKRRITAALGRMDHLNHLLSAGEISLARFNTANGELAAYLDDLRRALADLDARRADARLPLVPQPPPALNDVPEVRAFTLAVVDRSGTPIMAYGHFPVDESLITGVISAFDSLSEEMFGAHVRKTQLATGRVVSLARGRYTVAFVQFEDEPAPLQLTRLHDYVAAFEAANEPTLRSLPVDLSRLVEVPVPFVFRPYEPAGAADEPLS